MDIVVLLRLYPDLVPVLAPITDVQAFEALFLAPPSRTAKHKVKILPTKRLSKHVSAELPALEQAGLVQAASRREIKMYIDMFKVMKSETSSRLIINSVPVNELQCRPPRLELPTAPQLIHSGARWRLHNVIDLRHWFYQIPIAPEIRAYFGFRAHDGSTKVFSRLPMGWQRSMDVAQRIACRVADAAVTAVCKVRGAGCCAQQTYVDGVRLVSNDASTQRLLVAAFLLLLHKLKVDVNYKKSDFTISGESEFVGVQHSWDRQAHRLLPAWQRDLRAWYNSRRGRAWSWRDVLVLAGSLTWGFYALDWVRADLRDVFDLVAEAMQAPKNSWDEISPFSPSTAMDSLVELVCSAAWQPYRGASGRRFFAETDATPKQWGHVFLNLFKQVLSSCGGVFGGVLPIHIAELLGAVITIHHAATRPECQGSILILGIDNEVARIVLTKGHSPVPELNDLAREGWLVARSADMLVIPHRVDTSHNLADFPSRADLSPASAASLGISTECPGTLPHIKYTSAQPLRAASP